MKLLKLTTSNIFSIGSIDLDLNDRGLLLITGHSYDEGSANGAGKSSVANKSISWGLYGQTFGGSKADAVINSNHPDKVSYVDIEFIGVDGVYYDIHRQRNPAKLEFHSETINLTQRNEKDTQALINKALGKDFKTFSHTDFFGQGRSESFFSLVPADQKQIIESILPIDKLSVWAENCKKVRGELNKDLSEIKERKIRSEAYVNALEQQRNSLHSYSITWRASHETRLKNAKESIEKAKQNQTHTDEKIKEVQAELERLNKEKQNNSIHLTGIIGALNGVVEEKTKDLNKDLRQIAVYNTEIKFLEEQLEQLKFDGICTVCNQLISPDITKKKQEEIELKLFELKFDIKHLSFTIDSNREFLKETKNELVIHNSTYEVYEKYRSLVLEQKNKLAILQSNQHESMVKLHEENLKVIETEKNPHEESLSSTIKQYEIHKANAANEKNNVDVIEKELVLVKLWEDGYSYDIKTMMIEQACPFLEERTNQYMQDLNNPQIRATFSTLKLLKSGDSRDEFNITVKSMTGGKEFDLFSGGEQQLTSFACGMALADLASSQAEGSSEILILDEPFMGLSSKNCDNVISFLTQVIGKRKSTILLISNEEELKSLIPQSIHIVKRNGISNIEV